MVQLMLQSISLLIIVAIAILPLLCVVLYRRRRLRTCVLFSHLWCMIAFFALGLFVLHTARRHDDRMLYADKARRLMTISQTLRAGETQEGIARLDEFMAETLYRTAYDIPDEKMGAMTQNLLSAWQEVKEYYDTCDVNGLAGDWVLGRVRNKLSHVPWSDMQMAIRRFEQTYGTGVRAPAPEINLKSWFGPPLAKDDLKGKVILLDFWNTRCGPCLKSLPDLQRIHDIYKDRGLVVIACAGGDAGETKRYLDRQGHSFPAGMVSWQMYLDYAIRANPSYFLIDRDGRLVWGPEHRLPTDDELTVVLGIG